MVQPILDISNQSFMDCLHISHILLCCTDELKKAVEEWRVEATTAEEKSTDLLPAKRKAT